MPNHPYLNMDSLRVALNTTFQDDVRESLHIPMEGDYHLPRATGPWTFNPARTYQAQSGVADDLPHVPNGIFTVVSRWMGGSPSRRTYSLRTLTSGTLAGQRSIYDPDNRPVGTLNADGSRYLWRRYRDTLDPDIAAEAMLFLSGYFENAAHMDSTGTMVISDRYGNEITSSVYRHLCRHCNHMIAGDYRAYTWLCGSCYRGQAGNESAPRRPRPAPAAPLRSAINPENLL
jgi:hypothetical protein